MKLSTLAMKTDEEKEEGKEIPLNSENKALVNIVLILPSSFYLSISPSVCVFLTHGAWRNFGLDVLALVRVQFGPSARCD